MRPEREALREVIAAAYRRLQWSDIPPTADFAATHLLAAIEAHGVRLVPAQATPEMIAHARAMDHAGHSSLTFAETFAVMVVKAPYAPSSNDGMAEFDRTFRPGWDKDCPKCVGSKFTCDEHSSSNDEKEGGR